MAKKTITSTHYGFPNYICQKYNLENSFKLIYAKFFNEDPKLKEIIFYGEWVGPGIQKGVALNFLEEKFFVIFAVRKIYQENKVWAFDYHSETIIPTLELVDFDQNIISLENIYDFTTYEIEIDFNNPQEAVKLIEKYTWQVENLCPYSFSKGVTGIGEGIVWKPVPKEYNSSDFVFKTKGEKHSVVKTKKIVETNVKPLNEVAEFLSTVLTENRLNQGIEFLTESNLLVEPKSTSVFIKWIVSDIFKEEADRMDKEKESLYKKHIAAEAGKWFILQTKKF